MPITPQLLKSTRREERETAAAIGALSITLNEKVLQLFRDLNDPLLDADDVHALLGVTDSEVTDVKVSLSELVAQESLEADNRTRRPHDGPDTTLYRLRDENRRRLRLTAEQIKMPDETIRYHFSCDGRLIRSVAYVARLDALRREGNQRDEIPDHVSKIAQGIASGTNVPNAVLLVLKEDMVEEEIPNTNQDIPESSIVIRPLQDGWIESRHPLFSDHIIQCWRPVEIDFPYRAAAFDSEKSAQIVDGQQRTAALSLVDIDETPYVTLSVIAIPTDDDGARRIFEVANTSVKITTDFRRALLASTDDAQGYQAYEQQVAKAVSTLVLRDEESPFYKIVRHPGVRYERGNTPHIPHNSLFSLVKEMLAAGLGQFCETEEEICTLIKRSFLKVKEKWPDEWNRKPSETKLMHGAGLRGIAFLIEQKLSQILTANEDIVNVSDERLWVGVSEMLDTLKERVIWSTSAMAGANEEVQRWFTENVLSRQNTPTDIAKIKDSLQARLLINPSGRRHRRGGRRS